MAQDVPDGRDEAAVRQFVESFAAVLVESGMQRMPARVFVALLATDSGRLGAAELSDRLQASPAAISAAVRYLTQVNLISREREPGSRRDVYRVHDDVWYESSLHREHGLARWEQRLREGIRTLGPDSPAGERLQDSVAFIEFLQVEIPALLDRWREHRQSLRSHRADPRA